MSYNNKFDYVLRTFCRIYSIDPLGIDIGYGIQNQSKIRINDSGKEFLVNGETGNFDNIVHSNWLEQKIPFIFDSVEKENVIELGAFTLINYDIIAASFYFLSNWQEYSAANLDKLNRFSEKNSLQEKLKITHFPIVNYYFDILKTAIEKTHSKSLKLPQWNNKQFVTCITHDIDKCESAWKEGSYREFKKGNFAAPFQLFWKKFTGKDEWYNFDVIQEIESNFNATSSFYFLPFKGTKNGIKNADYDITKKKFDAVKKKIIQAGSEVGIHGSIGTSDDIVSFQRDIAKLGNKPIGNRFHYLKFNPKKTISVLENSGIKYDTTLGFADNYGFKCGICHPFYLYDIEYDRESSVLEIPLVLMDSTLSFSKYLKLKSEEAIEKIIPIIAEIIKFHGCFTILWHNTHFSEYKHTGWRKVFTDILNYCSTNGSLLVSGEKVYGIFTKRD
jgi:hypothetical protein